MFVSWDLDGSPLETEDAIPAEHLAKCRARSKQLTLLRESLIEATDWSAFEPCPYA